MATIPYTSREREAYGMNWLSRLLAPPVQPADQERTRKTDETLTLANDFIAEMRQDIEHDRRRRETDVGNTLLRARDRRGVAP